ncbi:MAG: hypothetical protein RL701_3018 [Pseudomonadota bacterium]
MAAFKAAIRLSVPRWDSGRKGDLLASPAGSQAGVSLCVGECIAGVAEQCYCTTPKPGRDKRNDAQRLGSASWRQHGESIVSQSQQFKVGDNAVYPAHGVAQITAIETREIAGHKKDFYILKILDSGMKLMIPTDGASRAGLRDVISKRDVKKVMDILKDPKVAVTVQPWNKRFREYTEMLTSGSAFEVAKVLRDLHRVKNEKELSFSERRLLEQARNLVVAELALAKNCDVERVQSELDSLLG